MRSNEEKAALGVEILKNCRNELYSYFPYLDGAFASVSYEAGKGVKGIGTEAVSYTHLDVYKRQEKGI